MPPDLTTRSGLREVHGRLPEIAEKLELIFMDACRAHDLRMLNVLVAIWLDMCPDVVLCQRLLERGMHVR